MSYMFTHTESLITYLFIQVTLEQEMISGALSTLNEEAFEDVTSNQNPMTSNGSTGELILQQNYLAPISEEYSSPTPSRSYDSFFDDANQFEIVNNNNNNVNNETTVIIMPNYSQNIDDTRL